MGDDEIRALRRILREWGMLVELEVIKINAE
jgi:hypothetical protein